MCVCLFLERNVVFCCCRCPIFEPETFANAYTMSEDVDLEPKQTKLSHLKTATAAAAMLNLCYLLHCLQSMPDISAVKRQFRV